MTQVERLESLEPKVEYGIVRCGVCGWLIRKGHAWRVGYNGPEHEAVRAPAVCGWPAGTG